MKKIWIFAVVAFMLSACTKESAFDITAVNSGATAAVSFSLNAPNYVTRNAGLRNAGSTAPTGFVALQDITAMLFDASSQQTLQSYDITNSIEWTGNSGSWAGGYLLVPVGTQHSLVIFNQSGMYDRSTGKATTYNTLLSNLRFHFSGSNAVDSIVNGFPAIHEIASSETITTTTIASRGTYTLGGTIKRINSKLQVNIAYSQAAMFAGLGTDIARIRISEIKINNLPESVDYNGENPSRSLYIKQSFKSKQNASATEKLLNGNKTDKGAVNVSDNVFSTLTFPFPGTRVSLAVKAEYTTDNGLKWNSITLSPININAIERNQILNLNIWLKNLRGDLNYGFSFEDWHVIIDDQDLDGEEV